MDEDAVVVISGSRRICDQVVVDDAIERGLQHFGVKPSVIVEGGQRTFNGKREIIGGVDYFAQQWARRNRIPHKRIDADWAAYGHAAGPIRNRQMAIAGDYLIAVPDAESRGTLDMIEAMGEYGKADRVFVATQGVEE